MHRPPLLVLIGPTASGKGSLALGLARRWNAEIVSADSQKVYRGMDIGTAKPSAATRAEIPHHGIDIVDPTEEMSAARFAAIADTAIDEITARQRRVIVAGGTGLYVRALLLGLFDGPPADPMLRARLREQSRSEGSAALWKRLEQVDPRSAERIHPTDERRLIRSLEIHELTGVPASEHHQRHDHRTVPPRYPAYLLGIERPRHELYRRIDQRVDRMIEAGVIDEVRALRQRGVQRTMRSQIAIAYKEVHAFLDGEVPFEETVRLIKRNSRHLARRQLSWYRRDEHVQWIPEEHALDAESIEAFFSTHARGDLEATRPRAPGQPNSP